MQGIQPDWVSILIKWADDNPLVSEVWVYGSRVKGGFRPNSDLDLAIRVAGQNEEEQFTNAFFEKSVWAEQLQKLLPVAVHVETMHSFDTVVSPAVLDHGILLYRSSTAN